MANQRPTPPQKTIYVSFSAGINVNTTESLIAVMADCAKQRATTVYLLFSSEGGSVMCGINLYNALRAMPFKLVTHNVGNVDSIGNAIFLAGDERYACAQSTFMFHGVGRPYNGNLSAKEAREIMGGLMADEARISSIVQQRSKLSEAEVRAFFGEAHTMNSAEAVTTGVVEDVRDVKIPPSSVIITVMSQR